MSEVPMKFAVVTGGNKGIGLEICTQLAAVKGVKVILTARDEKRGLEAVEKLLESSSSSSDEYNIDVIFHQLDVTDSQSVASLAQFVKSQFGKLDILVNNAGISGAEIDTDALKASFDAAAGGGTGGTKVNWNEIITEAYDLSMKCFETNYYGAKRTSEALLPLLQLSESPRIVNVSSSMGKLKHIQNEWAKGILKNAENFTELEVDGVVNEYLKDFKEGSLKAKCWPEDFGAYIVSKAAMNAHTRILAKRYPSFRINCVCPGFVKTDMTYHRGVLTVQEGAESPVRLALLPDDGPSGLFFDRKQVSSFEE